MVMGKIILFDPNLAMHKLHTLSHPHSALKPIKRIDFKENTVASLLTQGA